MTSPWTFRAMWPVEDEDAGYAEARAFAESELAQLAEQAGARIVGEVSWEMVEHEGDDWPHTPLVLVAVADAVPFRPTREQYPDLVRHLAELGYNDTRTGELLGIPAHSVTYVRRTHKIAAGVPSSYRSRDAVAEPKWDAA
jgi:hypothetical protein